MRSQHNLADAARRLLLPASEEDIDRLAEVATPSAHGYGGLTVMDPTYRSAKELTVYHIPLLSTDNLRLIALH